MADPTGDDPATEMRRVVALADDVAWALERAPELLRRYAVFLSDDLEWDEAARAEETAEALDGLLALTDTARVAERVRVSIDPDRLARALFDAMQAEARASGHHWDVYEPESDLIASHEGDIAFKELAARALAALETADDA